MGTKAPRNIRIEALRLVAICSIAIFHSFQPLFAHMTELMGPGLVPGAGDAASLVAATPAVATHPALGVQRAKPPLGATRGRPRLDAPP